MKTLSPTQYACLEAMGIDVWVSRKGSVVDSDNETEVITAVELAPLTENSSISLALKQTELNEEKPSLPDSIVKLEIPQDWPALRQAVSTCQHCELHTARSQTVFGVGNQKADWLIIGDKPSESDEQQGDPFSGKSGELLTAMLQAIGLTRQQVYLTNILKCVTPNNREPEQIEIKTCNQYLMQQIALIQPKLILLVGQSAAQRLLDTQTTMARLRQKTHALDGLNIPVVATYHPAYLLTMPSDKGKAWQDLLYAKKIMNAEAVL